MKLLFDANTGKIYHFVLDKDWFIFRHTTQLHLSIFEIDELIPDNQSIYRELILYKDILDINGDKKYYMYNNSGTWELHQRDNWEPVPPQEEIYM